MCLPIDLDLFSGGIGLSLNIDVTKNIFTAIDDMNNNRFTNLDDYIVKYNNDIDVLSAPIDPRLASKINVNYINVLLRKAKMKYKIIIVDTNHVDCSDKIVYVINNDPTSLKNMKTMLSIHKDMEQNNYKVVLNNSVNKQKNYFSDYDIENIIKNKIDYIIPSTFYIKNIDKYVMEGKILMLDKKIVKSHRKAYKVFSSLANDLIKETEGDE